MELIPVWAPNIHPLLVHFPIGIITLAALMNLFSLFLHKEWWDEKKNTIVYVIGLLSAIGVYYSGKSAADSVFLPTEAQTVLNNHADWALWLVWFFVAYAIIRIGLHYFKLFEKTVTKYLAFLAVLPGLFLLYETGEHGAEMVFGYSAGTGQLLELEETKIQNNAAESVALRSSYIQKENGDWTWQMNENSVADLIRNFHWIEGAVNNLTPEITKANDEFYLKLNTSNGSNTFVTHNNYQNVQVDYYIDLSAFEGEIKLIHHFVDIQNYDFLSFNTSGDVTQGRVINSEHKIFDEKKDISDSKFFRVVANDTHFRGYINKEMAVHGHGDAPRSGSVGLNIEGEGSILISRIELSQL